MKEIIAPIDKQILKSELKDKYFLRPTNKAQNIIYDLTAHDAPNVMLEIARLRELSYRHSGGSTGEDRDMDSMDTMDKPYHQIIVWNPEAEEIIGGYRYLHCKDCHLDEHGQPYITSAHLFHYSDYFIRHYLPYTIELGRAFVQPKYQTRDMGMKSLFALDNSWDGLGAMLYRNPDVKYLIGKVTIYPSYDPIARDLIYAYLRRFCYDKKGLFAPYHDIEIGTQAQEIADVVFEGDNPQINYHLLQKAVRARGTTIPPMFSAYLSLTTNIKAFGNAVNDELANVYETGMMIQIEDINQDKWIRYIGTYIEYIRSIIKNDRHHKKATK